MPNISADMHDGIGGWTTAQFVRAMREGVSPGGASEYPALPYTSYQRMTANDIRELLAYPMSRYSMRRGARRSIESVSAIYLRFNI
jgi:hypothetical protein